MDEPGGLIETDVLVVGGGINGAGIARDAAGRGLRVTLCEKDDLAAHTSSASSKLIHGGLRYLEHYEFGLVRKALAEREVLLRSAPHIMRPLRFVMPHDRGQRPAWLIRAGLYLYDTLARREFLPGSEAVALRAHAAGVPLKETFTRGFVYSDGWVDDARLVVLNAIAARERGATILTRTTCSALRRDAQHWTATLTHAGGSTQVKARCLVNAAGPWAAQFLQSASSARPRQALRLIKGSHIVVPRLFEHDYAYIFQHPDGRIVFAMPYEHAFTLIGTTDLDYDGDLDSVAITEREVGYLCELSNRYFKRAIAPADVVWTYSGVRPLVEGDATTAAAATRDFRLDMDADAAPMLTVLGGKITTFRKLAEEAVDRIAPLLGNRSGAWTAAACLPGGDLFGGKPSNRGVIEFGRWLDGVGRRYPWLPPPLAARYARAYGSRIEILLARRQGMHELGPQIVPGLYAAEVDYLIEHEWATCAADILWRRSKLGLHAGEGSAPLLDEWIAQRTRLA
ncbi:glycerol-3-phosphate dehydrogenase [Massilia sp. RP-1-19]|uniref:Glycerol-3-phosphate dehydrogenase n=1 Tax=Massilia polaris TaxID=2728846 RepID=A0A848HL30_9BURK|nr:glycerol-3-phosphate dehydrogenase [Massilia polaris]NML59953.1 glycerol-3-phosphate dehydrogenase [Massilia polaris]